MSIQRRSFIKTGLAAAGQVTAASAVLPAFEAEAATAFPTQNRAPLAPAAFLRLPPGAVKATGWLETQLGYQVNGLCGRFTEYSHFLNIDNNGWTNPNVAGGWEEVPYWLRGFVDLGFVTGDARVKTTAQQWVDRVLATQSPDGFFGPANLRTAANGHLDYWPHMPMLHALRSHAEFTGDARIEPFLTRYFVYLNAQPGSVISDNYWAARRCGDILDVIYWLYNRTGDTFLLDLTRKLHANSVDWVNGLPDRHNVNVAQGFREPAQYAVLSKDAAHTQATYTRYDQVQGTWGQFPGGGFAGDENARSGFADPRQGFETCGIVEYMMSHEILTRITGDAVWSDRTEELAFNSLPAALDPLGRSLHYVTSANSVDLDNVPKTQAQFQNGFAMQSFRQGVDQYRCCPHNYGMGWPYYVEEMWLATPEGGLCAALYGPCKLTTRLPGGTKVTITETTSYPFADTITLKLQLSRTANFPLVLRIPGWCASPQITVNGQLSEPKGGPRFVTLKQAWSDGDVIKIKLPAKPKVKRWPQQHGAVSVQQGALTFSLKIVENWVRTGGNDQWPEFDVHAGSAWNYGLVPKAAITVTHGGNVDDPFKPANAPVTLTVSAQKIAAWQADGQHVITPLQDGPVASAAAVESLTLIPMGAARLRITSFPQTGGTRQWLPAGAVWRIQNRHSGKVLGVAGMSMDNSANVVQFDDNGSTDHLWRLVDAGGGQLKIQCAHSNKVLAVEAMSQADSARIQQFDDNGSVDHLWTLVDIGDGWLRVRNVNSGKVLGVDGMSQGNSAQVVQFSDNGTADHDWRLVPDGVVKLVNINSAKVLAVEGMSQADSARVQQFSDVGSADQRWSFLPNADGSFRVRNLNSGKVLGVDGMSQADGVQVVQFSDNGTADHNWRIRVVAGVPTTLRLQNVNSGKVLAVDGMSQADSANITQFTDNGSADHNWRLM